MQRQPIMEDCSKQERVSGSYRLHWRKTRIFPKEQFQKTGFFSLMRMALFAVSALSKNTDFFHTNDRILGPYAFALNLSFFLNAFSRIKEWLFTNDWRTWENKTLALSTFTLVLSEWYFYLEHIPVRRNRGFANLAWRFLQGNFYQLRKMNKTRCGW